MTETTHGDIMRMLERPKMPRRRSEFPPGEVWAPLSGRHRRHALYRNIVVSNVDLSKVVFIPIVDIKMGQRNVTFKRDTKKVVVNPVKFARTKDFVDDPDLDLQMELEAGTALSVLIQRLHGLPSKNGGVPLEHLEAVSETLAMVTEKAVLARLRDRDDDVLRIDKEVVVDRLVEGLDACLRRSSPDDDASSSVRRFCDDYVQLLLRGPAPRGQTAGGGGPDRRCPHGDHAEGFSFQPGHRCCDADSSVPREG